MRERGLGAVDLKDATRLLAALRKLAHNAQAYFIAQRVKYGGKEQVFLLRFFWKKDWNFQAPSIDSVIVSF